MNAASYMAPSLPGGAIAQGSIFSAFGSGIGPAAAQLVTVFPLQTSLGGVSIKVIQGTTSVDAIPLFASSSQVNAVMPSTAPLGWVSVQITFNGVKSNMAPVQVVQSSPGIFAVSSAGVGPGIMQNFISQTKQPVNSLKVTAKPSQTVILWLTGLGPITAPDNLAPPAGNLPVSVEVFVGGKAVTKKAYSGRSPCCSGVDEIVFTVPADAPTGCYVPVLVRVNGTTVSNAVTVAIDAQGSACLDDANPFSKAFVSGQKYGAVMVRRRSIHVDVAVDQPQDIVMDTASADFRQETGGDFAFNANYALPPAGSCMAYTVAGDLSSDAAIAATAYKDLDAGGLSIAGAAGGAKPITQIKGATYAFYAALLGSDQFLPARLNPPPLFLAPGAFQLTGAGGSVVGAFNAAVNTTPNLTWTNRDQLTNLSRAQGVTFSWTGGGSSGVSVAGLSVDYPNNASGAFLCVVPAGATSFTVPGYVMGNLPASRAVTTQSVGFVSIENSPAGAPVTFNAAGLDYGAAFFVQSSAKTVVFQ